MKKLLIVTSFVLLFFSNVEARQISIPNGYEPFQVKKSGYALNLAYRTTGNWRNCLKWYKLEKGKMQKVTNKTRISVGDTLYLPTQITSKVSAKTAPLIVAVSTSPTEQRKTRDSPKKTNRSFIKTDFKKGIKDWSGNLGYSQDRDLNAGKKDKTKWKGYNWNGMVSVFPWKVQDWKIGLELRGNAGKGRMKKPGYQATYKYHRFEGGLATEKFKNDQTTGLGLGVSKQTTSQGGSPKGQKTLSLHARANYENEQRRARGEKVLPIQNISAEYQHQLSAKTSGGAEEYDESTLSVRGKTGLYDLNVSGVRVTPELNLETGKSWGKDSLFVGGGFGASVGIKKTDLAQIRFLNPRLYFQNEGASRLESFAISPNPDNIIRTIKASKVKVYKKD